MQNISILKKKNLNHKIAFFHFSKVLKTNQFFLNVIFNAEIYSLISANIKKISPLKKNLCTFVFLYVLKPKLTIVPNMLHFGWNPPTKAHPLDLKPLIPPHPPSLYRRMGPPIFDSLLQYVDSILYGNNHLNCYHSTYSNVWIPHFKKVYPTGAANSLWALENLADWGLTRQWLAWFRAENHKISLPALHQLVSTPYISTLKHSLTLTCKEEDIYRL